MSKQGKILMFIIIAFLLLLIATTMKKMGAGAVVSLAIVAIIGLYNFLFKQDEKSQEVEKKSNENFDLEK